MIDRFISIITWPTFAVLLRLIYSCFDIIGPYGVVCAVIRRDSVSILKFLFLFFLFFFFATSKIFRVKCHLLVVWSVHRVDFLPIFVFKLFSFYWCLYYQYCLCNQSSSTLFYVVVESLYRCIDAIFNARKSSYSFFSWHI